MSRAAEPGFESDVCNHVRTHQARQAAALPDSVLRKRVRIGIGRARGFGLTAQDSITAFVSLMFGIAPNFDQHPVVHRWLTDVSEEPDDRIDLLMEQMTPEQWSDVRKAADPDFWKKHEA